MGKAPAFQWYPGDWFREPGLKLVDLNVRGAWIELLMVMWDKNPRGMIDTHIDGLAKLWRISHQETCFVVDELHKNKIADVKYFDEDCQKCIEQTSNAFQEISDDVPFCPQNVPKKSPYRFIFVTIKNRRMLNEWNIKEKERLKKQKQREKKGKKPSCPKDVPEESTSLSSSSSSSSSSVLKRSPENGDFFQQKSSQYFESIESSCLKILKLPSKNSKGFNPCQFVNRKINKDNCHPGSINECLKQLIQYWETIESPWSYANNILKTSDGNWWEKEHIEDHEKLKQDFDNYIADSLIKDLIQDIGESVK